MLSADSFTYIWAYRVPAEKVGEFRRLYGPTGRWVRLFRKAPGYLDTVLHRDLNDPDRYVTIDRWESEEAFRDFRSRFSEEFENLDSEAESLTLEETSLGEFGPTE